MLIYTQGFWLRVPSGNLYISSPRQSQCLSLDLLLCHHIWSSRWWLSILSNRLVNIFQSLPQEVELQEPSEKHIINKQLERNIDILVDKFRSTMDPAAADKKCLSLVEKPAHKNLSDALSINSAVVHSLFKMDETREITQKENKCCTFVKRYNCRILFWLERILLFCFCAAIAGGYTVPIIIYAIDTDLGNTTKLSGDLDLTSCSNTVTQVCKWCGFYNNTVAMHACMH